jgi:hypothetical protein
MDHGLWEASRLVAVGDHHMIAHRHPSTLPVVLLSLTPCRRPGQADEGPAAASPCCVRSDNGP